MFRFITNLYRTFCILLLFFLSAHTAASNPNIVLIVMDDVAFTDLGVYGSEINTPNMDRIAEQGALFSNFHTPPTCAPSRASLMTGLPSHRAGVATLDHLRPIEHEPFPEYQGRLAADVPTLAEHLKQAGYATLITGKWHLGHTPESLPGARGFDRSFILDASGADNWLDRSYLPQYDQADWFEDMQRAELPDEFYSSEFLVDRMIDYINETPDGQPYLAYVGFQAIHIPVQAPREFIDRYDGVYDAGWEVHRQRRFAAAVERGLVPADATMSDPPERLRSWDSLSNRQRARSIRSMQVNAGMLEAMDHHFGRLVTHLQQRGDYENTIFVIMSDNGPEFNDPTERPAFRLWLRMTGYDQRLETLGERGSYAAIGPEWAFASAAPSDLFKFHATEGGTRVPLIISGPGIPQNDLITPFSFVTDITPTLLALTGVERLPHGPPFTGRSLVDVLEGRAAHVYPPDETISLEASGQSAAYRGDYKLVRNIDQYGDGVWRLFNLAVDPGETRDLAEEMPELFASMLEDYELYTQQWGVQPMPEGYSGEEMIQNRGREAILRTHGTTLIGMLVAVIFLVIVLIVLARHLLRKRKWRSA